jgi:hypothetical protein
MLSSAPPFSSPVNSNSRFQNIGAYLKKDSSKGFMIRAGSTTTTSFAKRLAEHFDCSKLKKDANKNER